MNESDLADGGCRGQYLHWNMSRNSYLIACPQQPISVLPCEYASVSGCRVCQSLMKSVPPSQVSFGRGVGQEGVGGRSSGVKDNRIRRAVCVHFTVTQHSHFLSLPFFFLLSHRPQLQTEDYVVEERNIETFVPSFLLPNICQKVPQQDDFGIVSAHHQWIFESCQSEWTCENPTNAPIYCLCLNFPVLPICSLPPYSHYGFSKTRPSVGSKSWTQSPPFGIRSSDGASYLGSSLTPSL